MITETVREADLRHQSLCLEENSIFSRHYCAYILVRRLSMCKELEAADIVPQLERVTHNFTNHSHCS